MIEIAHGMNYCKGVKMDSLKPIRVNDSPNQFEETLRDWIEDIQAATEFIQVASRLWYEKGIELILFRRQLLDRPATAILYKHSYSQNIISTPLKVQDSLLLAKTMFELDVAPARIDIGRLNSEWLEERDRYENDAKTFVAAKLSDFIGVQPRSDHYTDVVLYGFGRIGRLVARELVAQAGNGSQLRLRAVVTRPGKEDDLKKRAALFRRDSVHGNFKGIAIEDMEHSRMVINGHVVRFLAAANPEELDYESYGIKNALLIDNTGKLRERQGLGRHLKAKGVQRVPSDRAGQG